jgi:hypothetical protein
MSDHVQKCKARLCAKTLQGRGSTICEGCGQGINLDPGQLDNGNANAPTTFGNFVKPTHGRPGMLNQWNLQVQQELTKDMIMTIGYIGNSGAHLKSQEENINNMRVQLRAWRCVGQP